MWEALGGFVSTISSISSVHDMIKQWYIQKAPIGMRFRTRISVLIVPAGVSGTNDWILSQRASVPENVVIKTTQLLEKWQKRCRVNQRGHFIVADRLLAKNRLIGIPAIVLAAALGSGLLCTAQMEVGMRWRVVAGIAGISAAILTSFQLSADYHGLAEQHRHAAIRFDVLYREIDLLLALTSISEGLTLQAVERIRKELDSLFEQSPALSTKHLDDRRAAHVTDERRSGKYEDQPLGVNAS